MPAPGTRIAIRIAVFVALGAASAPGMADAEARWEVAEREAIRATGVVEESAITALDRADSVRVIVLYGEGSGPTRVAVASDAVEEDALRRTADAILVGLGPDEFELIAHFRGLAAFAGHIGRPGLGRLARDPRVRAVGLDARLLPQLDHSVPFLGFGVPQDQGLTGDGVTVAVIDSGIDSDHPDLSDDLVDERCFCSSSGGCCPAGASEQAGPGSAEDDDGHGTAVAGIVTSAGVVAAPGGAPDVGILAIRATPQAGVLDVEAAATDVVLAGNWIRLERPDVDIVNLSLATPTVYPSPCDGVDVVTTIGSALVEELREQGVLVVASSGNEIAATGMSLPACLDGVFAVGAIYDEEEPFPHTYWNEAGASCTDRTAEPDEVICFSNSDSTTDVFATGYGVWAPGIGGGLTDFGGTSAAAPLVASCAALLRQAYPDAGVAELERALRTSSTSVVDAKNGLAFPRLDCGEALVALPEPGVGARYVAALLALLALDAVARARRPASSATPAA